MPWVSKSGPVRTIWGVIWGPSRLPFPPAYRGKGYFRAPWECSRWPFPLPVEEKALSGPPQEAQHRPSSDDSGCQLWLLVIAFTPCLSRKRPSHGLVLGLAAAGLAWLGPGSTPGDSPGSSKQIRAAEGSSGMLCSPSSHGLDILSSPSSHVMCTCDGRSIIRVR